MKSIIVTIITPKKAKIDNTTIVTVLLRSPLIITKGVCWVVLVDVELNKIVVELLIEVNDCVVFVEVLVTGEIVVIVDVVVILLVVEVELVVVDTTVVELVELFDILSTEVDVIVLLADELVSEFKVLLVVIDTEVVDELVEMDNSGVDDDDDDDDDVEVIC